jgi:hypothetical protein
VGEGKPGETRGRGDRHVWGGVGGTGREGPGGEELNECIMHRVHSSPLYCLKRRIFVSKCS